MNQVEENNRQMAGILKVIDEIGLRTKVINDIVFQTKLLSFNASVEAARAGEHGKGFAVVAEEVGKLAQMSGGAAKEISSLLEGSIEQVQSIVQQTSANVEELISSAKTKVEIGTLDAKKCGGTLEEIVNQVSSVGSMLSEISRASQEQSKGVQEITKAMGELDLTAQQNSGVSQQGSASAEELNGQVGDLNQSRWYPTPDKTGEARCRAPHEKYRGWNRILVIWEQMPNYAGTPAARLNLTLGDSFRL